MLRWLLEHGADPNLRAARLPGTLGEKGTPFAYAAQLSSPTALETLLEYGAELDPQAIFYAIHMGRGQANCTATLEALIQHGADVNYVSKSWPTPLHHAVRWGQLEKLKLLLAHGADPEVRSLNTNMSALEYAKEQGRSEYYEPMEAARSKCAL